MGRFSKCPPEVSIAPSQHDQMLISLSRVRRIGIRVWRTFPDLTRCPARHLADDDVASRHIRSGPRSLRLDTRFANDAGVVVDLTAQIAGEIRTAETGRNKSLRVELGLDLRYLHGCGKPAGKLRDAILGRLGRRERAKPSCDLI